MSQIVRHGTSPRWADVVVHRGTAFWVEVAEDVSQDAAGQIRQVLSQIDATLASLNADRTALLQVLVYLSDLADAAALNQHWDAWVVPGHAPVRACVQAGLSGNCRVEMVLTCAVTESETPPG